MSSQCSDGAEGGNAEVMKQLISRLEKQEEEIALLKQTVSSGEEARKIQDKKLEALTEEVHELKMVNAESDQKQEIGELRVEINNIEESYKLQDDKVDALKEEMDDLKEEIKNIPMKLGAGASQPAIFCTEENEYKWELHWYAVDLGENRVSSEFYCGTNEFECKLTAYKTFIDRLMEITFVPSEPTNFPDGTMFQIKLEGLLGHGVYEKICDIQVIKYVQGIGNMSVHSWPECGYKKFMYRGYINLKCTWSYDSRGKKDDDQDDDSEDSDCYYADGYSS